MKSVGRREVGAGLLVVEVGKGRNPLLIGETTAIKSGKDASPNQENNHPLKGRLQFEIRVITKREGGDK